MKTFVGIDLGSTTSKAVLVDEDGRVIGRGLTNSRSNYVMATRVARENARIDARLGIFRRGLAALESWALDAAPRDRVVAETERALAKERFLAPLAALHEACGRLVRARTDRHATVDDVDEVFVRMRGDVETLFAPGARRRSEFFRDLAGAAFRRHAEAVAREARGAGDRMIAIFDKAVIEVENDEAALVNDETFRRSLGAALATAPESRAHADAVEALERALAIPLDEEVLIGTGYGRVTLPFAKECIRSEILCHGLGAHLMYPDTRTVLDIGGQDTKAIRVDRAGIVTSFQMNDRCAAGCGRYLGYIAEEMGIGLHELGPLASASDRPSRISSTCTVFAGAELRDRLAIGEKREDILAGLHRAMMLRAMSIVSRAGGVVDQFTFTGGVAKNPAAVRELRKLIHEGYGDVTINIDADSIYTGALGAAEFARRSRIASRAVVGHEGVS